MSDCIPHLSILHSPVFLLNSCLDLFSAPHTSLHEDPLFRRYGVNLPSSLTMNLPSALVYSTRLRVSVYGTGIFIVELSGFSWEQDYLHYCAIRGFCILSSFSSRGGFACPYRRLRSLTGYSVSPRKCHNSVSTSPIKIVTEY